MGNSSLYFFQYYYYLVIAMYFYLVLISGNAIESPKYTVMHSESDFEIRLYLEPSWMSALVRGATSFEKSTKDGFHRLYQYLKGGNLDHSQITMTAPVLTSIDSSSSSSSSPPSRGSDYIVRYYVSTKYVGNPPQPNPELNLQFDKWRSHCIAVRKFTGFAKDDNAKKESEALVNILNKYLTGINGAVMVDKSFYSVAQYNSSRHLSGRLNEVWIDVSGFAAEGCPRYQGK
ncbi:hypothetical protein I3843_06G064100 [Carya illinoinensis]|uniref:SOUL heme-binding protein n=1 Tax=Carya illinoinensis TaxID=32201 RepID=A0A8T1Q8S7_CARIL|nr:uncharacterized protein LOC122313059 [Carya illinoinensis]KAG2701944.1 hypothetical protein I3760_06G068900 [Carya illinoinensis]KAG6650821.1 hypothetical protein CIPAW_06G069300 [Carya illinoinensis]KAG6708200.1 hypothetical protein I3842_06G069200 [Carya illinoinensis]KAG7974751.1 hypothetical protein I3843_06G064100 [Carya illinoinensis]